MIRILEGAIDSMFEKKLDGWLLYNDRRPIFISVLSISAVLVLGLSLFLIIAHFPSGQGENVGWVIVATLGYLCTLVGGLGILCFSLLIPFCGIHFLRRLIGQKPDTFLSIPIHWTK
ncbi:hypothetical protein ACVWZB_004815 [Paenibacillus polymyxa]